MCWCILIDISICNECKQGDKQSDKKLKAHGEFGTNGVILSVSDIIPDQMTFYSCCMYTTKEITAHVGFIVIQKQNRGIIKCFICLWLLLIEEVYHQIK